MSLPVLKLNLNAGSSECACEPEVVTTPVVSSNSVLQYIEDLCFRLYGRKPVSILPFQVMGRSADFFSDDKAFFATSLTLFDSGNDVLPSTGGGGGGEDELLPVLTMSNIAETTSTATWNSITDASGYVLLRNTSDNAPGAATRYSGALYTFNDTGLTGSTNYWYWIKALKPALPDLTGSIVAIIGDSYVQLGIPQGAFTSMGMTIGYADGIGGSCLGSGQEFHNDGVTSRPTIYSRFPAFLAAGLSAGATVYVMEACQNDWPDYSGAGGTGPTPIGTVSSTDTTTLYGALNGIVDMWNAHKEAHPTHIFIFLTRIITSNADPSDPQYAYDVQEPYATVPYQVMVNAGLHAVDLFHWTGITMDNIHDYAADYVHPTDDPSVYRAAIVSYLTTPYVGDHKKITTLAGTSLVPVISSSANATGEATVAMTYQITASNTPTSYAATGLPSGLSINTSTGLISGTPAAAGTSTITVSATNATGTGTRVVTLIVAISGETILTAASYNTATIQNTAGTWNGVTIVGSGNWGRRLIFDQHIPASTAGRVYIKAPTQPTYGGILSLRLNSTNDDTILNGLAWFYLNPSSVGYVIQVKLNSGGIALSTTWNSGDDYSLYRDSGGTITLETRSGGGSWTVIHTFTGTSTATLYIQGDVGDYMGDKAVLVRPTGIGVA